MQEVRLSEPHRGVNVERVEAGNIAQSRVGDLGGAGMRHTIGGADDEAVEGVARIQRRALQAVDLVARPGCRALRDDAADRNMAHLGT